MLRQLRTTRNWSRPRLALAYLGGAIASSALVIFGAHQTVPVAFVWLGSGLALGVGTLLYLASGLRRVACEVGTGKSITGLLVLSGVGLVLTEILQQEVVAAGAVAVGLPVALLVDNDVDTGKVRSSVSLALFIVGVVGIAVGWTLLVWCGSAGARLLGATLAIVALALFRLGFPGVLDHTLGTPSIRAGRNLRRYLGHVAAAAAALSFGLLFVRGHRLAATGVFLFALASTLYAEHTLGKEPLGFKKSDASDLPRWTWPQVALHAVVGAGAVVWGVNRALSYLGEWRSMVLFIAVLFTLVGAFSILRGELLAGILLVCVVWGWTVHETTIGQQEVAADTQLVVALGDSFTAGQGANEFFDGNNSIDTDDASSCRRSPFSYSSLLAKKLNDEQGPDSWSTLNLACSGAKSADISERPQKSTGPGALTQIDALTAAAEDHDLENRLGLVVLTIGGNDVGFATVAAACMLPSQCSERTFWHSLAYDLRHPNSGLQANLAAVDEAVSQIVGDREVPVVVLLYPQIVRDLDCDIALSTDERDFVTDLTGILNRSIVDVVSSTEGLVAFPHSFEAFDDGGGTRRSMLLCDDPRGANFLHLLPHDGPLRERFNPVNWKDGSGHPRLTGHARFAEVLAPWVLEGFQRLSEGKPFSSYSEADFASLPTGQPEGYEPTDLIVGARLSDDESALADAENDWIVSELSNTSRTVAPGLAALISGGVLLASAAYGGWGRGRLFPRPPSQRES